MIIRPSTTETKQKVPVKKLSIRVPDWMKTMVTERAASLDFTVSRYVRRLVTREIKVEPLSVVLSNNDEI